jgi:hypothetical protein
VVYGVNVTVIVQLAPAAKLLGQLFVWRKSTELVSMSEMLTKELPVLESVTVCGVLVKPTPSGPNVRLLGETVTTGWTPVPVRLTVCGLPLALSVMASDALREPAAVGVNVTLMPQAAPIATLLAQLFVSAKSPGFAPPMAILEMFREALPSLERVTLCAALVAPIFCWLNVRMLGEKITTGAEGGGE